MHRALRGHFVVSMAHLLAALATAVGGLILATSPNLVTGASHAAAPVAATLSATGQQGSGKSFVAGAAGSLGSAPIAFDKIAQPSSEGKLYTTLVIGPDNRLYAGTLKGEILRFDIAPDGTLGTPYVISSLQSYGGTKELRALIGTVFDPSSTADNLILWVAHGSSKLTSAPNWSGKISRMSGPNLESVQDVVINFPRSFKDHMTNGIAFRSGEPNALYINQGSQSAMGAPDNEWGMRAEELLAGAVLRLDLNKLPAKLPLDIKTNEGGTYNPYAPDAPVTIFATGLRNAYDLTWHSNGQLYVPTNGSAIGGNVPSLPADYASLPQCSNRLDSALLGHYIYTGTVPLALNHVPKTQKDWLFRVVEGGYYGHPNPLRCEWVYSGGNPTANPDYAQAIQYPVGTQPDRNYRGAAYDFGNNQSANGVIEYRSNSFGGALKGYLLVARYSIGDDLIALLPGGPNLDIVDAKLGIEGFTGFNDPLDLIEDTRNGNIYVAELSGQKLTLLRPRDTPLANPS